MALAPGSLTTFDAMFLAAAGGPFLIAIRIRTRNDFIPYGALRMPQGDGHVVVEHRIRTTNDGVREALGHSSLYRFSSDAEAASEVMDGEFQENVL